MDEILDTIEAMWRKSDMKHLWTGSEGNPEIILYLHHLGYKFGTDTYNAMRDLLKKELSDRRMKMWNRINQ